MTSILLQNYFELFGFPAKYDIDLKKLSNVYLDLQKTVHPDRYVNSSHREKMLSVQKATTINEAFNCLKSPILRAKYLLEVNNVNYDDETETIQDPDFLMEQMELREALGEIGEISESNSAITKLERMMHDLTTRITRDQQKLTNLLSELSEDNLLKAKTVIQKMQFLLKLKREAEVIEEDLVNSV